MRWASSVAAGVNLSECAQQAAYEIRTQLGGETPDLVIAFISPHFKSSFGQLPALLQEHLPSNHLIGCSAGGVIGGGLEIENRPALSITAALLPDVQIHPIHSDTSDLPDEDAAPEVWRAWLGLRDWPNAHFIVLADPFSVMLEPFLNGLDYTYPAGAKIGGLASGGRGVGQNALYLDGQHHDRGLVAVALSGNILVDTIVAQGCRPIGAPLTVTKSSQNLLVEVDGRSPLQYLGELIEKLDESDRELMRTSLFLGLQMDPFNVEPHRGDFLIRNLTGIDYQSGTLAVGAMLQTGQLVQFHLRDKATSAEDLDAMLSAYAGNLSRKNIAGALLFSCVGRGHFLYGHANHDSQQFLKTVAPVPLGGFFCNGEIGPIAGATHLHGYTSSFGIFRPIG